MICGDVSDGEQAIEGVQRWFPDVVVLDVTMPKGNGIDVAELVKLVPETRVIMFTMHESDSVVDAYSAGRESVTG